MRVRLARRHVLDLLLSEHYGDCYCVPAQRQLRAPGPGRGVRHRPSSASATRNTPGGRGRRLELLGRARHEQVHPLPALRAHLHRPAGGRRPRGGATAATRHEIATFGDRPLVERRLHQLRPVHQPLPHRGAARQGRDRRRVGGARRPRQARGHPDRAGAARGDGRVLRPRARHPRDLRDEHGPASASASTTSSTPTSPPTSPSSRRAPSCSSASTRRWSKRTRRSPCRSSRAARRATVASRAPCTGGRRLGVLR